MRGDCLLGDLRQLSLLAWSMVHGIAKLATARRLPYESRADILKFAKIRHRQLLARPYPLNLYIRASWLVSASGSRPFIDPYFLRGEDEPGDGEQWRHRGALGHWPGGVPTFVYSQTLGTIVKKTGKQSAFPWTSRISRNRRAALSRAVFPSLRHRQQRGRLGCWAG